MYGWDEVLGNTNVTVAEKNVFHKIMKSLKAILMG